MSLSRDVLLNFKPRLKEVSLPDDNGSVYVRELRASEVIQFSKDQTTDATAAVYKLIVLATVDENGSPVFQPSDIGEVHKILYQVSNTIVDAILELSGLKDDAKKKLPAD